MERGMALPANTSFDVQGVNLKGKFQRCILFYPQIYPSARLSRYDLKSR